MTKDEALKMAIKEMTEAIPHLDIHFDDYFEAINACKKALEQPTDYLYVYKGSEVWIKDSLDIPSARFLIGKIRLEK